MQTSYGIVGVKGVTVTMTTTKDELPRVTNSEGDVVVGTNMAAHRARLVRDGAEEVRLFPVGGDK